MIAKGHHIGAADDNNFEYGLDCILDHAGRLIEQGAKSATRQPKTAKSAAGGQRKPPAARGRNKG
jgi:hypothetical protein